MNKITIIGLGITGNSIGLGLRRATAAQGTRIVGFDPERALEQTALRKYSSVDEIAPDLEGAVRGADLVILATPMAAGREVLEAIGPFLEQGATVTDTFPLKVETLALAGELLGDRASFVGGHPFALTIDLDVADEETPPNADLFKGAPWCIMPARGATNDSLNTVINLAEVLGAKPIFIDPTEHDSFLAAVSHLPVMASAALLRSVTGSPAWSDMSGLAHGRFRSVSEGADYDPDLLATTLMHNRQLLVTWIDQYMNALYDLRTLVAQGDEEEFAKALRGAREQRTQWASSEAGDAEDAKLRAELRQTLNESRPAQALMGTYLTERFFRRKERGGGSGQR